MSMRTTSVVVVVVAGALLSASCSDDGESPSAEAATTASTATAAGSQSSRTSFCLALDEAFGGYQPGFDVIFEDNPEPTLEELAEFLPGPTAELDAVLARLDAVEPPGDDPEIAAAAQEAIDAMHVVGDNFHAGIEAAEAGDQAEFDRLETKNQDVDLPAMQEAMGSMGSLCEQPAG